MLACKIFITSFAFVIRFSIATDDAVVDTTLGKLRGHVLSTEFGNEGLFFQGIPYAEPPIGCLRFLPSRLISKSWHGTKDALVSPPDCVEPKFFAESQSEDCLYLNVYTGRRCLESQDCPVLVYIFGGNFAFGSPRQFNAEIITNHFVAEDIVFVLPNYRLNVLASWNTGTKDAPGNIWSHDHKTVLEWVQREIVHFGGDKSRVTVMGCSSGGMSASLVTLSPKMHNLFSQDALMSGSAITPAISGGKLKSNGSAQIALKGGCIRRPEDWELKSKASIVKCMRKLPTSFFQEELESDPAAMSADIFLGKDELFPKDLNGLLADRKPFNLMTGVTTREYSIYMVPSIKASGLSKQELQLTLFGMCFLNAYLYDLPPSVELAQACTKYYGSLGLPLPTQVGEMISDIVFNLPPIFDARNNSKNGGHSYIYRFEYLPEGEDPDTHPGHAEDLQFVLWHTTSKSKKDLAAEKLYTALYVNFIKYGRMNFPAVNFWFEQAPAIAARGDGGGRGRGGGRGGRGGRGRGGRGRGGWSDRTIPALEATKNAASLVFTHIQQGRDPTPHMQTLLRSASQLGAQLSPTNTGTAIAGVTGTGMVLTVLFSVIGIGLIGSLVVFMRQKSAYELIP